MTDSEVHEITITVDLRELAKVEDARLAMLWHVGQANPAPLGDHAAGDLAQKIGCEIIRRWLKATPPELYKHQGKDYYWDWLRRFAKYEPGEGSPYDRRWHQGQWVPLPAANDESGSVAPEEG